MKRVLALSILFALTAVIVGCADNAAITKSSTEMKVRKIEAAHPWFYEKGVGYEGGLSAIEVSRCLLHLDFSPPLDSNDSKSYYETVKGKFVWDPTTPEVKKARWFAEIAEKVKTGNSDAITEVITTLHQLIQAYHPDKVGFSFSLRTYPYAFVMDLVGSKKAEVLSWKEILENLGIEDEPGVVQLVNLLPSSEQAVKVRYVKNSLESLCLAYRKFMVDADNLWYLNKKEYKVSFNREKDMINFSLYRRATLPLIGGDFSPDDKRISTFNPNIWDFEKLINTKYKGLIYYSEFD
ncbi:hypothetical protein HHJ78_00695 [Mobiluncus mulieris]|uniref:Lipoprotein n=1 Tax=Mobiluncus mulieris TaxID=2052 RepID=A0A7Y0TZN5_9ACTO|nr:hypothetical protein [Mobiluncus mulieris]NMW64092.1 hypothetical protein [Mobiluncus mulieris]